MNPSLINWLAVVAAAASSFALGGIWYSPLVFANAWMKDSRLTHEEVKASNMARTFGCTALFSLIMSANLAAFLATPAAAYVNGTSIPVDGGRTGSI